MKQVATFEKLLGFCNKHGAMYNPGNAAITPAALGALLTSAQESLKAAIDARIAYVNAVHEQRKVIANLNPYMTRIVNALAAHEVQSATLEEAYAILLKFRSGNRSKEGQKAGTNETGPTPSPIRKRSYQDVLTKIENFEALVNLVRKDNSYAPNESDLQVGALEDYASRLRAAYKTVMDSSVNLSTAKVQRNKALYSAMGIHSIASLVKRYVKSVFGYKSEAFAQIRGLKFDTIQ